MKSTLLVVVCRQFIRVVNHLFAFAQGLHLTLIVTLIPTVAGQYDAFTVQSDALLTDAILLIVQ